MLLAVTNLSFYMSRSWEVLGLVSIAGNLTPRMVSLQLCREGEGGGESLTGGVPSIKPSSCGLFFWEVEGQNSGLVLPRQHLGGKSFLSSISFISEFYNELWS